MKARTVSVLCYLFLGMLVLAAVVGVMLLFSCRAPDRWSAEATRGRGQLDVDGPRNDGDRDFDSTAFTLGVSGPLLTSKVDHEHPTPVAVQSAPPVDLSPVVEELRALRAELKVHKEAIQSASEEAPSAVKNGAATASILSLGAGLVYAGIKAWAWRKEQKGEA